MDLGNLFPQRDRRPKLLAVQLPILVRIRPCHDKIDVGLLDTPPTRRGFREQFWQLMWLDAGNRSTSNHGRGQRPTSNHGRGRVLVGGRGAYVPVSQ